jgi:hypothetical protein
VSIQNLTRRAGIVAAGIILGLLGFSGAALADDYYPPHEPPKKEKCNAGNGNGSEGCDPGNSSGVNRGGDEASTQEDFLPNPGGNNVP